MADNPTALRVLLEIGRTGLDALVRNRLRNLVTTFALLILLVPFLAGLGLAKGVEDEAQTSIEAGPDLYVTALRFGRPAPVPLTVVEPLRQLEGVTAVVPRIVGAVLLGKDNENVVVVGLPAERFPASVTCIEGRLCRPSSLHELVVGTELARRLHLEVGSRLLPFYHNRQGERLSQVVGIFKSDDPFWQANLILTTFEAAAAIFDQPGLATDLLISCRPRYEAALRSKILSMSFPPAADGGSVVPQVTTREDLRALLPAGLLHREGIFNLHFLLAFVLGIGVVLVTSGFGLSERRREVGILKATGWQTDQILFRSLVENLVLSLAGAALSILLAFAWLRGLNGYWIAGVFLAGVDTHPGFRVPFRLTPVPSLLAFVIALLVVLSGSLYSTWRAAIAPPFEAMR
jgi:ABC-type lipoprotein release transport system permease subunit